MKPKVGLPHLCCGMLCFLLRPTQPPNTQATREMSPKPCPKGPNSPVECKVGATPDGTSKSTLQHLLNGACPLPCPPPSPRLLPSFDPGGHPQHRARSKDASRLGAMWPPHCAPFPSSPLCKGNTDPLLLSWTHLSHGCFPGPWGLQGERQTFPFHIAPHQASAGSPMSA